MNEGDGGNINWRDTDKWTRDVNGYAVCPCCGAMIHGQVVDLHAERCYAIKQALGEPVTSHPVPPEVEYG